MKLVKSLLLGSAAGLCAVAGAQAADLPIRAAAPVEYVRVCTAHGAGFFYIPGTDTCIRIGGRARFSYQYMSSNANGTNINGQAGGQVGADKSAYQSLAFFNIDSRTSTAYGTLRTFLRLQAAYTTGGFMTSSSSQRYGESYFATGQDTFGRANTTMFLDKAFIQFAGFTAGKAGSFYDFYAHDLEMIGITAGSDVSSTNLLAYTATFGNGWSATLSVEDPTARRYPIFADQVWSSGTLGSAISSSPALWQLGGVFTQTVPFAFNAAGLPTLVANYDVSQRQLVPDFVGVIRYDAAWGAVQLSAASHELRGGQLYNVQTLAYDANGLPVLQAAANPNLGTVAAAQGLAAVAAANAAGVGLPPLKMKEAMGWAIQGGLKLNLPQLATGDVLWLQAAYAEGALQYAGPTRCCGRETLGVSWGGRFQVSTVDSFIGTDGKQHLTDSWSVVGAFLHYWTPEWRSAVFGSYGEVSFGKGARGNGPAGLTFNPAAANAISGANSIAFNSTLRDYSTSAVGANLIWSPVKDLDIGLEAIYTRVDLKGGRTTDLTLGTAALGNNLGNNLPAKTAKSDDLWSVRMRVQRDF